MTATPAPQGHPRAASIERATGTGFATWVTRLDEAGGRERDHAAIAGMLVDRWGVGEWWAQSLTVAYEQHIGRRVVGQSCEGDFGASASRTVDGGIDQVREQWHRFMTAPRRQELGLGEGRLTDSQKWRYWRADVEDGSKLSVNVTAKPGRAGGGTDDAPRSTLAIEHKGIESAQARDAWKGAWKAVLTDFTTWTKENRDR